MLTTHVGVQGEAMVDAGWENEEEPLGEFHADPALLEIPEVEVSTPIETESNLLVHVKMFFKERLDLLRCEREIYI